MNRFIVISVFAILILNASGGFGQRFEAGLFGGTSYYLGDLNPEPTGHFVNAELPAIGFFGRYNHNNHISVKMGLNYGKISGTDENSPFNILGSSATYTFETRITELAIQGEVNFLPYVAGDPGSMYTPYIFGGTGGFTYFNTDKFLSFDDFSYALIFGVGFRFFVTNKISGGLEWGWRTTATDYLDNVHLGGNPKTNDWYSFAGLMLTFRFKDKSKAICPH